jgi:carbonic anhydrase
MQSFEKLLANNKQWAGEQVKEDPDFFKRLESLQSPEFLWIGCRDSRVPANQITGTRPGEVFVHRNIANLVLADDLNVLSVLQFAVEVLKVKHIIVCGHYGCGGIKAALSNQHFGLLDNWLNHIKKIYLLNKPELEKLKDVEMEDRLTEMNVKFQVQTLAGLPVIVNSWAQDSRPCLHGWVYSLGNGIIKPLIKLDPSTPVS